MDIEVVWTGHDNYIGLVLKSNGVAVSLASVTSMTLTLNGDTYTSTNGATAVIRWNKSGYETGEVRLYLGDLVITTGSYKGVLVVYEPLYTNGLVWGEISIKFNAEVEEV